MDVATGVVTKRKSMIYARSSHGICYNKGKVYCAGGFLHFTNKEHKELSMDQKMRLRKSVEVYNI